MHTLASRKCKQACISLVLSCYTSSMVKKKLEAKIKQDPVSVIILILVFIVLSVGTLIYLHAVQRQQIRELRADVEYLQELQLER